MFIFQTGVGEPAMLGQTTSQIPRAENRWTGNRGGFTDPAAELLVIAPGDVTPITVKLDRPITSCTGGDILVSPVRQNPTAGIPT